MTASNKYWQCTECNYNSSNLPEIKLHEHDNLTLVEETKPTTSNNDCLVCNNPTYTWYDVFRDNCGKENYGLLELCDEHQLNIRMQLKDMIKRK